PCPPGLDLVHVAFNNETPVRTTPDAQHAEHAVPLHQGDHTSGTGRRSLLHMGVLHRDRPPRHRLERDAEALDETGNLGHHSTTFSMPVARMFISEIGMRYFHANVWSWSPRRRG